VASRRRGLVACMAAPARLNWYRALRSRRGARYVAGGLAVGVFLAFIPLFVLHFPIAVIAAYLLRVSRLAAVAGVCLSNPLTLVPFFIVARLTGLAVLPSPGTAPQPLPDGLGGGQLWAYLSSLGWYDVWTILIGGSLLGLLGGGLTYRVGMRWALDYSEKRREWRDEAGARSVQRSGAIIDGD